MKILMVTPYVPYPPSSGGQIRTLNLLKHLSLKNKITLVALYKNHAEREYYSYLKKYCKKIYLSPRPEKPWQFKNIFKTIFSFYPFLVVRNFSPEASRTIDSLLKKEHFDVIHAETFYVMPHIPKTETPIVLVEQTIEYNVYKHFVNSLPIFLRMLFYFDIDIMKLKYWEKHFWEKASIVVAVSTPDEQIIKTQGYKIDTSVIPNGAGDEMIVPKLYPKSLAKPTVFFQGNFFWLQNVEAAEFIIRNIAPKLLETNPEIKIKIAGQNAQKIGVKGGKNVEIINIAHGDSEKVRDLFRDATIFIAPIFGPGGTRLKILAAMGSGVPVVSTVTGVEGLDVEDGKHVLIANNPEEFQERIISITKDKTAYERIRENSYNLVREKYQWKQIANKLESLYRQLLKK